LSALTPEQQEHYDRAYRYIKGKPIKGYMMESYLPNHHPSITTMKLCLDIYVDTAPHIDLFIMHPSWKKTFMQVSGTARIQFMGTHWYKYRDRYVEFKKKVT
jgi:hypothetical protein